MALATGWSPPCELQEPVDLVPYSLGDGVIYQISATFLKYEHIPLKWKNTATN